MTASRSPAFRLWHFSSTSTSRTAYVSASHATNMSVDEAAISSTVQPILSRAFARVPKLLADISLDGEGKKAATLKPLPDALADLGNPEACRSCQVPILRGSCSPVCLACGSSIVDALRVGSDGQQNPDQSASTGSGAPGFQHVEWKGSIAQRSFLSTLEFKPQDDKVSDVKLPSNSVWIQRLDSAMLFSHKSVPNTATFQPGE